MCSIYGAIGRSYTQIIEAFSPHLRHRGPDDEGQYYDSERQLVLGHNRLSIIDLSNAGHQPMSDQTGETTIVFNGEIYNYKELRSCLQAQGFRFRTHSDTEVVLNSYRCWGEACLHRLRGMFAFCIHDRGRDELFLARDRLGIKPLLYTFREGQFIFTSELRPLLETSIVKTRLDMEAVGDYFRYGSVRQPKTILEGVYALMPGCSMRVGFDLSSRIERYYDLTAEAQKRPPIDDYSEAVQAVRAVLEEATQYHMVADVPVAAFLSGGVDSTSVVALMQRYADRPINTYSIGFDRQAGVPDETDVARRTAEAIGTRHHTITVDDAYVERIFDGFIRSIDQPSIDGINTYMVSGETAREMKVALSGLGGDEIFAGYPHFNLIRQSCRRGKGVFSRLGAAIHARRPNRFTRPLAFAGLREEEAIDEQRRIHKDLTAVLSRPSERKAPPVYQGLSPLQKISKAELDRYLLSTLLRDGDSLSMAHALELRPVLLDHELVELAFGLSDSFKIRDGQLKSIFIDSVRDLIPEEVWQRRKTGFDMPYPRWMNGRLNEKFKELLRQPQAQQLFTAEYLRSLEDRVAQRKTKRADWMALVFLSWIEQYGVAV